MSTMARRSLLALVMALMAIPLLAWFVVTAASKTARFYSELQSSRPAGNLNIE